MFQSLHYINEDVYTDGYAPYMHIWYIGIEGTTSYSKVLPDVTSHLSKQQQFRPNNSYRQKGKLNLYTSGTFEASFQPDICVIMHRLNRRHLFWQ